MQTFTKKGLIHFAMTIALAISVGQCAYAGLDNNFEKLAYQTNGISVYGNDSGENMYLEDGEQYIIDANSPEAKSIPSTTRLTGNIQIAGSKDKISISLRDADVRQVLRMFADKAKMNVIFHESAKGNVTLDLKDTTINSALEYVLDACELTYVRQDNNLIIASKEAIKDISYTRQNFTVIPVKYVSAQAIANFLNKGIFNGKYQGVSPVPVVTVNAAKNELMVFGTEEDEKMVNKILSKLDQKPMLNVFPVNHITPKEMAATICDTILSDKSEGGAGNGVNPGGNRGGGSDEITLGGGYTVCVVGESNGTIDRGDTSNDDLPSYASNPMIVAYFPEHGTVAVYGGSVEQVKMVENFIKLHDKKQPMAYIELAMIELSESGTKEFQNSWRMWTPFATFEFNQNGLSTDPLGPVFLRGKEYVVLKEDGTIDKIVQKNSARTGSKSYSPIVMALNYLLTNGKGRMLANPKVMVTNGKKSTVDLTHDYLKSTKSQFSEGYLSPISTRTLEIGSDAGIKIDITPFISPDGYVVMNLNPNYITTGLPLSSGDDTYTLAARNNLTLENVRVKDGETLVLAGMISENETQSTTKLPVLGDLPVVGPFFRSTSNTREKREMVILVTPHIVYSQEQIEHLKASQLENL